MSKKKFAEVVVGLPIERPFTYAIPASMSKAMEVGKRVWVPFRNKKMIGYVVDLKETTSFSSPKEIFDIIDGEPILNAQMLCLAKWIARRFCCSWGEAIEAVIPGPLRSGRIKVKSVTLSESSFEVGIATREKGAKIQDKCSQAQLTSQQSAALEPISKKIDKSKFDVFLLHGITGSGKTEIYLQAISQAVEQGKSSIVLVPEISLTPQTQERFEARFGHLVAILHSGLTGSQRYREWKRIKDGRARIVVGARSAIFSPVENLGLIIIDEEHETTYKQEDVPRYHTRDVAIKRAKQNRAVVILGSATPSLETYHNVQCGRFKLIRLTERIDERALPHVQIVDMRDALFERKRPTVFSRVLENGIRGALEKNEQVILFLNRRGFATFANCKKCGLVLKCKQCNVTLVYHFDTKMLVCHQCNYRIEPPTVCPQCNTSYIHYFGIGTQKVESEAHRLFPQAKIARMDSDITSKRGAHARILGEFKEHRIDILVGTQMIAKGLDFPRVTLVGVISADTPLYVPDFRAGERTFSLLTQVAGRAGRGDVQGKVIVQTYTPDHYAIKAASKHDYMSFFQQEIATRNQLALPPFRHMASVMVRGREERRVIKAAHHLANWLEAERGDRRVEIVGPAPALISKMRGQFRWNVFLKGEKTETICDILRWTQEKFRKRKGTILTVDVDPL